MHVAVIDVYAYDDVPGVEGALRKPVASLLFPDGLKTPTGNEGEMTQKLDVAKKGQQTPTVIEFILHGLPEMKVASLVNAEGEEEIPRIVSDFLPAIIPRFYGSVTGDPQASPAEPLMPGREVNVR